MYMLLRLFQLKLKFCEKKNNTSCCGHKGAREQLPLPEPVLLGSMGQHLNCFLPITGLSWHVAAPRGRGRKRAQPLPQGILGGAPPQPCF